MRIAQPAPPHCSSCYAQQPDLVHIDFEAAYDGPVFEQGIVGDDGEVTNSIKVAIDDLVICETCLKQAAKMIGWCQPDETMEQVTELEEANENLREKLLERVDYSRQLEQALNAKKQLAKA